MRKFIIAAFFPCILLGGCATIPSDMILVNKAKLMMSLGACQEQKKELNRLQKWAESMWF